MKVRPYADATTGGIALGLVLLASFILAGRGIGASGAFAATAGPVAATLASGAIESQVSLADRLRTATNDGSRGRISRAIAGGALMGLGARLAWGCTSGLALSGGALLSTGAWTFIPLAFGTAIIVTALARDSRLEGST